MIDRIQDEQPATPAEIASDGDETQRAVPLAMAEEINRRHGVVLDEPTTMYDAEGRVLSATAIRELHDRVANGLEDPTTVYNGEGRPFFIGSYNNGEY